MQQGQWCVYINNAVKFLNLANDEILSNHYVQTGYQEMGMHCRDSVSVLAVTRADVLKVALDIRYQVRLL